MQQFDREYFAERKAQIAEMHHLRKKIWLNRIAGLIMLIPVLGSIVAMLIFEHFLWLPFLMKYPVIDIPMMVPIIGAILFEIKAYWMHLIYADQQRLHNAIQQEYELLRPLIQPEKAKRNGYEYEEITWHDDDDEFLDDFPLEEQIRQRVRSRE